MPSLIPTFEYDIFISYRHNDNLDGWVTDFVQNLEKELRGTIKEPLSIYFDKNPHDGLLETHNVDKSLEGKLKCLIFIPIFSQTYCDTKSFAWQREFVAFNKLAKEDALGRDIKLGNGNVASRILPIKIHDLDADDKGLIETEIGGAIRAIEFIYQEPGVNRPLKITDDRTINQNKKDYRNQINKTANAAKEIIQALKNPTPPEKIKTISQPVSTSANKLTPMKVMGGVLLVLLLFLAAYWMLPKSNQVVTDKKALDRTIAVLPFIDLSESKDQEWFADGLAEEILNSLTHVDSLHVISRTSSFAFKGKNLPIQKIGDSLLVNYVVEGSVRKSNAGLRITAQLIRVQDGFHVWSNTYDRNSKDIFEVQSDIASQVAKSLDISLDPIAVKNMYWSGTKNAEAYVAFLKGVELSDKAHRASEFFDLAFLAKANPFFEEASRLDPEFVSPYLYHADLYHHIILKDGYFPKDTTSEQHAYRMLVQDLDNVIKHSKDESQKNYYSISRIMFSDNWSRLTEVIKKSLDDSNFQERFKFQLIDIASLVIYLGHGDPLALTANKILETEPQNTYAKFHLISNAMHHGRFAEVIEYNEKNGGSNLYALLAMYHLGMFNEMADKLEKIDTKTSTAFTDIEALMLAHEGRLDEAKVLMKKERRLLASYIFAVDKIFGRHEANRFAKTLDEKPILHYLLVRSLIVSPANPPFDLSATPNLARRLKQTGITLDQNGQRANK
jgi:TolB-like protein